MKMDASVMVKGYGDNNFSQSVSQSVIYYCIINIECVFTS